MSSSFAFCVGILLLCSRFLLFLPVVATATTTTTTTATFELFDNGASTGGIAVTLSKAEFPKADDDDNDEEYAGEMFAHHMSQQWINVTKFGQSPGSVRSSKAFREDGERIVRFEQLLPDDDDDTTQYSHHQHQRQRRRVYLVADGLEFVWPFIEYGHQQVVSPRVLPPLQPDQKPVIVESLSDSPRVFKIHNLFSQQESQALMDHVLTLEGDKALKRSTVGTKKGAENDGASVDRGRTSENAWDSVSPTAKVMITRSFQLTGIEEDIGKVDGLQIVRYTPGTFYNTHPDYFSSNSDPDFNFNPYSGGSNRFATVFMYMNNVDEGGSTVFPNAPSANPPTEPPPHAQDMFQKTSLEYNLLWECHRKLAVPPQQGTAALFYSITPDGRVDPRAFHGACPVIQGTKWGANIWIWNKQRYGDVKTGDPRRLTITNAMTIDDDILLYITWESKPNGMVHPGQTVQVGTYEFHRFKAHQGSHDGETVAEFTVQSEPESQEWIIQPARRWTNDNNNNNKNDNEAEDGLKEIPSRGNGEAHSEL